MKNIENKKNKLSAALEEINKSIKQVNFGEVVVTIHNAKVVQVEKREKKRFDK